MSSFIWYIFVGERSLFRHRGGSIGPQMCFILSKASGSFSKRRLCSAKLPAEFRI